MKIIIFFFSVLLLSQWDFRRAWQWNRISMSFYGVIAASSVFSSRSSEMLVFHSPVENAQMKAKFRLQTLSFKSFGIDPENYRVKLWESIFLGNFGDAFEIFIKNKNTTEKRKRERLKILFVDEPESFSHIESTNNDWF